MRIKILWLGKTKNPAIRTLVQDYLERTRHLVACEVLEARDPGKAKSLKGAERILLEAAELSRFLDGTARTVALDERGKAFSSEDFARWFEVEQNRGTRDIVFVIGGADGLDTGITGKAGLVLSLGRMTWTHDMCRVLLLEQIYRAFSILKKLPYHK